MSLSCKKDILETVKKKKKKTYKFMSLEVKAMQNVYLDYEGTILF